MDRLKLKDLIRAGQREVTVRDAYEFEDLPVKNPVQVAAHCELNATGVKVSGHYDAVIEDECDRCCEMFERRAKGAFEERFVYQALLDEIPGDKELQEEDYYETIGPDGVLDLKDLIRQFLVIAVSTDRLCNRAECELHA